VSPVQFYFVFCAYGGRGNGNFEDADGVLDSTDNNDNDGRRNRATSEGNPAYGAPCTLAVAHGVSPENGATAREIPRATGALSGATITGSHTDGLSLEG
jgi:hypothetical protein